MLWLLFTIPFYIFWRRWFGSSSNEFLKTSRAVKCVCFIVITYLICYVISKSYLFSLLFAGIGYIFFCLSVGPAFDCGRDGLPDEEMIKRYNKGPYHYLPDLLIPKEHRYKYLYDLIWLGVRYVLPMLAIICLPIVNWRFIFISMLISPVYALCWSLKDYDRWLLEKIPYTNGKPTALAEFICGGLFGLYPLFIGG